MVTSARAGSGYELLPPVGLPAAEGLTGGHGPYDQLLRPAAEAARTALARRGDVDLVSAVEAFAGPAQIPQGDRPVFLLVRAMPSADHEMQRFVDLCEGVGAEPVVITMLADRFTHLNADKFRRARMRFWWQGRTRVLRAADLRGADGRPMSALATRRGGGLADFHRAYLAAVHPGVRVLDRSDWLRPGGRSDYVRFFALAMVGCVLVEAIDDDPLEQVFFAERVLPAWDRTCRLFAAEPLLTCHYTPAEILDDYWWGYPGGCFGLAAELLGRRVAAGASPAAAAVPPAAATVAAPIGEHLGRLHA